MKDRLRAVGWPTWVALVVLVAFAGGAALVVASRADDRDPFASYCAEVREQQTAIGAALAAGQATGLLRALPAFEALQDKAPRDLRDEWSVVVSSISALDAALREAGVDPATYRADAPPPGLDPAAAEAISTAAVRLGARGTAAALAGVQQQARDVCKTALGL